jgi:hypothetical protein
VKGIFLGSKFSFQDAFSLTLSQSFEIQLQTQQTDIISHTSTLPQTYTHMSALGADTGRDVNKIELEKDHGRNRVIESMVPFVGISKHGYTPPPNYPEHQGYGVGKWSILLGESDRATKTLEQYYLEEVPADMGDDDQDDREEQDRSRTDPHELHTPEIAETESSWKGCGFPTARTGYSILMSQRLFWLVQWRIETQRKPKETPQRQQDPQWNFILSPSRGRDGLSCSN